MSIREISLRLIRWLLLRSATTIILQVTAGLAKNNNKHGIFQK